MSGEKLNGMTSDSGSGTCLSRDSASIDESSDALPSTSAHQFHCITTTEGISNLGIALRISDAEERTDVHDVYNSSNRIFETFFMVKFQQSVSGVTVHAHADAKVVLSPDVQPVSVRDHGHCGGQHTFPVKDAVMSSGWGDDDRIDEAIQLSEIERQVVDRLISLGDTIEQHCGEEIDKLLTSLRAIKSPTETLRKIAELVFKEAQLNWGRILVFFYFVVRFFLRYAAERLAQGLANLASIVANALKDICTVRIFQWIADHGGWRRLTPIGGARVVSFDPFLSSLTFIILALGTAFFLGRARVFF